MQILWSKRFAEENPWEPEYSGVFHERNGQLHFFFKGREGLSVIAEADAKATTVYSGKVSLPGQWILAASPAGDFLFYQEQIFPQGLLQQRVLDLCTLQVTENVPEEAVRSYQAQVKPLYHYEEASFSSGAYCIAHKGSWGYECFRNGEPIWQFNGYAWLYTDVFFYKDRVFFGTSGQGGYFYVLDLQTGKALTKLKTGGTKHIIREGEYCYVLQNGKQCSLICVDLTDGRIRQAVQLPGAAGPSAILQRTGERLQAITFEKKNDRMRNACWTCLALT